MQRSRAYSSSPSVIQNIVESPYPGIPLRFLSNFFRGFIRPLTRRPLHSRSSPRSSIKIQFSRKNNILSQQSPASNIHAANPVSSPLSTGTTQPPPGVHSSNPFARIRSKKHCAQHRSARIYIVIKRNATYSRGAAPRSESCTAESATTTTTTTTAGTVPLLSSPLPLSLSPVVEFLALTAPRAHSTYTPPRYPLSRTRALHVTHLHPAPG